MNKMTDADLRNSLAREDSTSFVSKEFVNKFKIQNRKYEIVIRDKTGWFELDNSIMYATEEEAILNNADVMAGSYSDMDELDKYVLNDNNTFVETFTNDNNFLEGVDYD